MSPRKTLLVVLFLFLGALFSIAQPDPHPVAATGSIFGEFKTAYPDSLSKSAGCQLCHVDSYGGNGWNAYGWSIRQGINDDDLTIAAAIAAVETLDADGNGGRQLRVLMVWQLP